MSKSYYDKNFVEMNLASRNQLEITCSQQEMQLQQVSYSQESPTEKRIENMLLSHSKYYVFCE